MTNIKTFHFQNEESISSDSSEWQGTQTTQSNLTDSQNLSYVHERVYFNLDG